jgi:hypothetical protein
MTSFRKAEVASCSYHDIYHSVSSTFMTKMTVWSENYALIGPEDSRNAPELCTVSNMKDLPTLRNLYPQCSFPKSVTSSPGKFLITQASSKTKA